MTPGLWVVAPLACLGGGTFAVYLLARLWPRRWSGVRNGVLAAFTALVFALALGALGVLNALVQGVGAHGFLVSEMPTWGSMGPGGVFLRADFAFLRADPGAVVVIGVALGLGLLVAIYSGRYLTLDRRYETYYPLLLLLVTGLVGMSLSVDLFNLYLYCELMSVAAYALVAFRRDTDTAIEAGFKYLIMGSVGTVSMLLGISFIYRYTGQLTLPQAAFGGPWGRAGTAFLLVGLAIKGALVPVHTWLPDAHGRAPSSISAMLSGIVIQSALYALLKAVLGLGMPPRVLGTLLVIVALGNMTLGNVMALVQTHAKRLLAFSTIAQVGYVLFGIGAGLRDGAPLAIGAGFLFIASHAVIKGLAFLSKGASHFYCHTTLVTDLRGTAQRLPLVAITLALALGGLAGVPPLAGFAAKWSVLASASHGADVLVYVGMALFLLNSVVALGYYLPFIITLFAAAPSPGERPQAVSLWMAVPLLVLGGLVIAIGIYPAPWIAWTEGIGEYLLSFAAP